MKTKTYYGSLLVVGAGSIAVSHAIVYPLWTLLLVAWTAMAAVVGRVRYTLNTNQMRVHVVSMLAFPIAGTAWKAYQQATNYSHVGIPNRLQHLIWAAMMVGLILPVLVCGWRKFSTLKVILQTLVCISAIGLLGEIGEFVVHENYTIAAFGEYFGRHDTMLDIVMNAIGGAMAAALCSYFRKDSDPVPTLHFAGRNLYFPLI
jgi:hypothetical protein